MSRTITGSHYSTTVNNRLQKFETDWAIYQANKAKAEFQKNILYKEIKYLVEKHQVSQADVARHAGLHRQQINIILKMVGGESTT